MFKLNRLSAGDLCFGKQGKSTRYQYRQVCMTLLEGQKPRLGQFNLNKKGSNPNGIQEIVPIAGNDLVKELNYTASRIFSASCRSTETSWLTPRSAMVTPNNRFILAMVIGLWVMITKRVSVDAAISSMRLQKRSTL